MKALFFIHITKAAGTSLRKALREALGRRLVPVYKDSIPNWDPAAVAARRHPDRPVFFGHFEWGFHEILGESPRYATVLRHPINRAASWYNWMGSHKHLPGHHAVRSGVPLADFLHSGRRLDTMVGMISGSASADDTEAFDVARQHLMEFDFVTVAEFLNKDSELLKKALNIDHLDVGFENRSILRNQLGREDVEAVRKYYALDFHLYEFARQIALSRSPELATIPRS